MMAKFCIDPGHGGSDSGAVGPTGIEEDTVVLRISEYLCSLLEDYEHVVLCTRTSDIYV